ncbi:hypothetical protein FW320_29410 [Azospirillum sp. Vi22]|uniref:hypothetical protein n=1 Tax=Azospirillum baldaniorum TaxID=1064539 RepID=UPI00157B64E6|nr:hypothetical protein [Azospirillum baldaniorum]NUB10267.1 hypothetical protein [Azospirillum baldaniorum]
MTEFQRTFQEARRKSASVSLKELLPNTPKAEVKLSAGGNGEDHKRYVEEYHERVRASKQRLRVVG